ncbi:response regulator [Pleurocapsales cyanobacterium LEGE 06147]|nr:response regulator [Pleurocapsales cyanobacterium LEGE 06147]
MKILLIEDDESLADLVKKTLIDQQNCTVDWTQDGYEGLELTDLFEYDLILLDLSLPNLDGIEVCRKSRNKGDRTPILLLTRHDTVTKKVKGLDAGADDYLVKPFNLQELLARIRALVRRGNDSLLPAIQWNDLCLDLNNCQVTYQKKPLKLTAKEYALLELFLRNPQRIFSQSSLLDHLWALEEIPTENAVRTQIKGLRQKLKQAGVTFDPIETIYGLGYRLKQQSPSKLAKTKEQSTVQITVDKSRESEEEYGNLDQQELFIPPHLYRIWQQHQSQYLNRVRVLQQAVRALKTGQLKPSLLQQAIELAHTLTGSLGSFGLARASEQSRQIEQILRSCDLDDAEVVNYLSESVEKLLACLNPQLTEVSSFYTVDPRSLSSSGSHRLLIVDDDLTLTQALIVEAIAWGLEVIVANDISQAREILATETPDIILLDLSFPDCTEGGFGLLEELAKRKPSISTIVFTAKESFADRVRVARLGGKGFLQKPISTNQVMEAISQVLQQSSPPVAKILVVDWEPQILDLIRTLLEPWGFKVILVEDARQFWDALEQSNPDLLVINMEMPDVSGIELCRVVRNDPRWYQLPVLFISAQNNARTVQQVFTVGADDYICQPIVPEELLARILNRLDKERYRRQLAEIDSLTGVTNRRTSIQQLTRLINLAKRQQKPCCFIILDLDNFKQINDCYGHDLGDRVLRTLGQLLKQAFRREDVIARWGGEEFVLGLYDTTKEASLARLTKFLADFRQQEFGNAERTFQVSFSAGVAQYPIDGTNLDTLYQAADIALYQAKATGKNQILGAV